MYEYYRGYWLIDAGCKCIVEVCALDVMAIIDENTMQAKVSLFMLFVC
jgi:hypothetical protein